MIDAIVSSVQARAISCDRSGSGSCPVAQSVRDMCVQAVVVLQAGLGLCVTPQERSVAVKCVGGGTILAHSAALCWSYSHCYMCHITVMLQMMA